MPKPSLERDSLFQLNLLIWTSLPQPVDAPITPVLNNAGYELWSIEQPLQAGVGELPRLRAATIQIGPNPVVDAVLHWGENNRYVLVECKPDSFGVASQLATQARGILVAGGNVASRLNLVGSPTAEVCYLVPIDSAHYIDQTLIDLSDEIANRGFLGCETGSIGIHTGPDGVYIGLNQEPLGKATLPRRLFPPQKVVSTPPGQDPRPLYIIPWIPDAPDSSDELAFREKVRVQLLAWLGKASIGTSVTLGFNELLDDISRGVFRKWRNRDSLHGRVFPKLGSVIRQLLSDDTRVTIKTSAIEVGLGSDKDRQELLEQVRVADLSKEIPDGYQLPLD